MSTSIFIPQFASNLQFIDMITPIIIHILTPMFTYMSTPIFTPKFDKKLQFIALIKPTITHILTPMFTHLFAC